MKRLILLALPTLMILACGGDGGATTTEPAPTTISPATTAAPTTTEAPTTTAAETTTTAAVAAGLTIEVGSSDLGDFLVDSEGRTLYLFVPDAQGAPTCNDDCAANWPALTGEVSAGTGVDAALLGTATRVDGAVQVTYNGWPLYYFIGDEAAADTNGQGIGDVWWVVTPAGDAIMS